MKVTQYKYRDDAGSVVLITRRRRDGLSTYTLLVRTVSDFEVESEVSSQVAAEALRRMRNRHSKSVFHIP